MHLHSFTVPENGELVSPYISLYVFVHSGIINVVCLEKNSANSLIIYLFSCFKKILILNYEIHALPNHDYLVSLHQ